MEMRFWKIQAKVWCFIFSVVFVLLCRPDPSFSLRIKDIVEIEGVRDNQLIGYGLVVGLKGTGDKMGTDFTLQSLVNMLERMGVSVDKKDVSVKNVAAVVVTAELPAFAKVGSRLDALVSSIGDAQSLLGGTLLLTPLKGPDGKIYAVAQGPISIGGFAFGGAGGRAQVNHPTVGRIVGGTWVEEEIVFRFNDKKEITIALHHPDFTTITRMVQAINRGLQMDLAVAVDAGTARISIPSQYQGHLTDLIARIELIEVVPDIRARVVLDERTGTVVMGENVRVSLVAISHGNLSIIIKERPQVSQPLPFAPSPPIGGGAVVTEEGVTLAPGGQTVVTPDTEIQVEEQESKLNILPRNVSIGDLVRALNALGVSPRDLIAILQTIKAAGALHAELEII